MISLVYKVTYTRRNNFYDAQTKKYMELKQYEKYFLNLVYPNQIWHQTELHLVLNISEKGNHNPNLVWINQIQKRFSLCEGCVE